ncbi:MAG: NUDIX domain-containing protein [Acidimicrobiia bacterium]|nr:NUDIX domain-containing protein [Acidimicrobiia bacterium]
MLVEHRNAGQWLPTGGHVGPGEHPATAARREIAEELQISPQVHPAVGPQPLLVTRRRTSVGPRVTPT